eukprot:TRINITY_DN7472_c0_g1_i3.p1 TRINITY_DN7472_c0_g1~~TRINITY_DN7472_c0_g1_i3.p1  ORF type:complete len:217 (-),score=42.51 TRINITY_DN7472_c0_g1_i3:269-919(-)
MGKKRGAGRTQILDGGCLSHKQNTSSRPTNQTIRNCEKCKSNLMEKLDRQNNTFDDQYDFVDKQVSRKYLRPHALCGGYGNDKSKYYWNVNKKLNTVQRYSMVGKFQFEKGNMKQSNLLPDIDELDDDFCEEQIEFEDDEDNVESSSNILCLSNFIVDGDDARKSYDSVAEQDVVVQQDQQSVLFGESSSTEIDDWEQISEISGISLSSFEIVENY